MKTIKTITLSIINILVKLSAPFTRLVPGEILGNVNICRVSHREGYYDCYFNKLKIASLFHGPDILTRYFQLLVFSTLNLIQSFKTIYINPLSIESLELK